MILQHFQERNSVWVILNYLLFSKIRILLILQQLKVRILVPWECVGWIFMRHTSVNIFGKYLFKFRQIYCSHCTNTYCNLNKYSVKSPHSLAESHCMKDTLQCIESASNSFIENQYEKMQSRKGSRTCLCYLYFNLSNFNFASSAMLCDDAMTMLLFCRRVLMIALRRWTVPQCTPFDKLTCWLCIKTNTFCKLENYI